MNRRNEIRLKCGHEYHAQKNHVQDLCITRFNVIKLRLIDREVVVCL
jgi:hypothetical protein